MPWKEPMRERRKMVEDWGSGLYGVSELSQRYGVSRQNVYKWVRRYEEEGVEGLREKSRAPQRCPHKISERVGQAIVAARRAHPTWGPRKLLKWLERRQPGLELPAASTAGELLMREGLVSKRRRAQRRGQPPIEKREAAIEPNEVWTIDFKGQFRTGDGVYCYPLTVIDEATRYLLGCQALCATTITLSRRTLERIFAEHGLPGVIRSDNGSPFCAANSALGLTELSVWWTELGIGHHRIEPGHPEQNGAHERFHRTLKRDTTSPPAANGRAQQRRFSRFRHEYNHERPHQALGDVPPAERWRPSQRTYSGRVAEPEYPAHWLVRRVDHSGHFKLRSQQLFLCCPLRRKWIGLDEIGDGLWAIHFHHLELARYDEREGKLHV